VNVGVESSAQDSIEVDLAAWKTQFSESVDKAKVEIQSQKIDPITVR
jgi:hypothetical protein